jgi:hypothetical protein
VGAWGFGIRHDDFVCDLVGAFEDELKAGRSVAEATSAVSAKYGGAIDDDVEGPLFWIALADVQWTYGQLDPAVLDHARRDFESGRSLLAWNEDPAGLAKRRAVLEQFIQRVGAANPRPKKSPKIISRPPPFQPGQCLSIRLSTGEFAAAIVLGADHSSIEVGMNLVAVLDYRSMHEPAMDVFLKRAWLTLTDPGGRTRVDIAWYLPNRFRTVKKRIRVAGQVTILESDPTDSSIYCGWAKIGERAHPALS